MVTANREYKNSVFTDYFSDKARLLEAYNAIAGTNYSLDAEVGFKTLQNVLFRTQNNDIAFTIEDKFIVLIEHQSTINENMPQRLLQYVDEVYKRSVPQKTLYRKKLVKIPTPEFIVIYNGKNDYPDKTTLRLSDAFMGELSGAPKLELVVDVYNIAKGHNAKLLKRSVALSDYATFVSMVYEQTSSGVTLKEAIEKTMRDCMKRDIMKAYLEVRGSEVQNMLINEWNDEEAREVAVEEGMAEGLEKGLARGRSEGLAEGLSQASADFARAMKADGVDLALISKYTGMSTEALAAI